jgi:hypothetical protein
VKQPQPWPQPREVQTQVASAVLDEKELDNLIQVWKSGWIGANGSFAKEVESALSTYFAGLSHHRHLAKVVIARHSLDQDHRRSIAQLHQGIFDP